MREGVSSLQTSFLAALAYFDAFDYPLTLGELLRYRCLMDAADLPASGDGAEPSFSGALEALAKGAVGEKDGYYFLAGRAAMTETRSLRYRLAEKKFAKAGRFARFCSLLPSVRLIGVCNSLALSNAGADSDIDLFIVCRPGTVWATRLVVSGALKLLGMRPNGDESADMYCASFLISEDHLDLAGLALPGGDTYLHYWIASLVPLFDAGGVYGKFMAANDWIRLRLPGAYSRGSSPRLFRGSRSLRWTGVFLPLLKAIEKPARRLQHRLLPAAIRDMANLDSRVVLSDDLLKFHTNDRRAQYEDGFRRRLSALGLDRASTPRYAELERA